MKKNNSNYVKRLRFRIKKLLIRKDRVTSRIMYHAVEHIDSAFTQLTKKNIDGACTHLALAANSLIKHLKKDYKIKRKSDVDTTDNLDG